MVANGSNQRRKEKGFYTVTVANSCKIICSCKGYHTVHICSHTIAVAEKEQCLRESIQHAKNDAKKGKGKGKQSTSGGTGRKGSVARKSRTYDSGNCGVVQAQQPVFTEIWHNNNPLKICKVDNIPEDKRCAEKTCKMLFPRGRIGSRALNIAISHKEQWTWTDKTTGEQRLRNKLTTKYYCPNSTCILRRFPYFSKDILEVPAGIVLEDCHRELIKQRFGFEI